MNIGSLIAKAHEKRFNGDIIGAVELYLEAAHHGSGHAAHELGVLYITGGEGLEPDFEKSQYWLNKSLESTLSQQLQVIQNGSRKQPNTSLQPTSGRVAAFLG